MEVYLDNGATTQMDEKVTETMNDCSSGNYGNPSSLHKMGAKAKKSIEKARTQVSKVIGARKNEIYFTSGGTESDNLALLGAYKGNKDKKHIVTTEIEHPAILEVCRFLKNEYQVEVDYVRPNHYGLIDPAAIEEKINDDKTLLVSVMTVNNENGAIQPIKEIGYIVAAHKNVLFHTDAIGAIGQIPINVEEWKVDILSMDAHKIHGPKGVGALYVREDKRKQICPILFGGNQENKLRSGTENVLGIVGMGKAYEIIASGEHRARITEMIRLRNKLLEGIHKISGVRINGPIGTDLTYRAPNNVNVSFDGIDKGEKLLLALSKEGIYVSTGCACTSKSKRPSRVLMACGISKAEAMCTIRLTLSTRTHEKEIDYVLDILPQIVTKLRNKPSLVR
jgi:cysteine desulfurase